MTDEQITVNHGAVFELAPCPLVGFDLDDVLANMRDPMVQSVSRKSGQEIKVSEWIDYNFFSRFMSSHEFLQMIIDDKMLETCLPEPDAVQAIQMLREAGFKVAIVTARGYHPDAHGVTSAWLEKHGIEVDSLQIVAPGQTKVEALSRLSGLVAYVDDHVPHLQSMADTGSEVNLYLMTRPWNSEDASFDRLHTVSEYAERVLIDHGHKASAASDFSIRPRP